MASRSEENSTASPTGVPVAWRRCTESSWADVAAFRGPPHGEQLPVLARLHDGGTFPVAGGADAAKHRAMLSPAARASGSRFRTSSAAPSPKTTPSAPASRGRLPVADSPWNWARGQVFATPRREHASTDGQVALSVPQRPHAEVNRVERRGAGGIDGQDLDLLTQQPLRDGRVALRAASAGRPRSASGQPPLPGEARKPAVASGESPAARAISPTAARSSISS